MLKVTFEIIALTDGYIPPFTGHIIQGFFLRTLQKINPELSKKLHDAQLIKPYAVMPLKPLNSKMKVKSNMWYIEKSKGYQFGFSIIDPELEPVIINNFISQAITEIQLANLSFTITKIDLKRKTFDELLREGMNNDPNNNGKLDFYFRTPVQFKQKDKKYPVILPIPKLVFSNLARIWNSYSPLKVDFDELVNWVSQNLFVRELKIVSREVDIGKKEKIVGFKGRVSYITKSDKINNWVLILSKFSEFSNIGNKRTRGLGVTTFRYYTPKTKE